MMPLKEWILLQLRRGGGTAAGEQAKLPAPPRLLRATERMLLETLITKAEGEGLFFSLQQAVIRQEVGRCVNGTRSTRPAQGMPFPHFLMPFLA